MTSVIFAAHKQANLVRELVKHCRNLGTEVRVISRPDPEGLSYPAVCNWSFIEVCKQMAGQDFFWLEADSIPLTPDWFEKITDEWEQVKADGKKILWSLNPEQLEDKCTGIGCYSHDILDHLDGIEESTVNGYSYGFDGWILNNRPHLIARTPLIEHSYGTYGRDGNATLHRHYKSSGEAVIFHKDQYQDLIPGAKKHFGHSGDLGDIIQALPILQAAGKANYLWLYDRPWTNHIERRYHLIEPLLSAQPYIKCVAVGNGKSIDYDIAEFRQIYNPYQALTETQSDWMNKKYGLPKVRGDKQWLFCNKSEESKGRVVVARSPRYHNSHFPWSKIVNHLREEILFIGLKQEHEAFCAEFGPVEYKSTQNMLEAAELIAGSTLFIGNQSSPNSIAEGLKHPRIQETNLRVPDCIFSGSKNAQYVADGRVVLPAIGDKEGLVIESPYSGFRPYTLSECPPKGWQYPGLTSQYSIQVQGDILAKKDGISRQEAMDSIYQVALERIPEYFRTSMPDGLLRGVTKAKQHAGLL